jgi:hypothetical protein
MKRGGPHRGSSLQTMSIRFERLVACTKEISARIAFVGVRVPGHLYPMTTLARKLQARGHEVVFISVLDAEPPTQMHPLSCARQDLFEGAK